MSSYEATRCRHIKVNGTQCGSPALRSKKFCFYHQQARPLEIECYSDSPYATGEIALPYLEDAHSVQAVIRQVIQMVMQKRIERKTAGLILYALQIATSNLKRIELEKPQPEQVVTNLVVEAGNPIAALEALTLEEPKNAEPKSAETENAETEADLPPGTIQACVRPCGQDEKTGLGLSGAWKSPRDRHSWNPTLAQKTRKDGAPSGVAKAGKQLLGGTGLGWTGLGWTGLGWTGLGWTGFVGQDFAVPTSQQQRRPDGQSSAADTCRDLREHR